MKNIIFDMDGLLIDSENINFNIYKDYLSQIGYRYTKEMYISLLGKRKEFAQQQFKKDFGSSFPFDLFWEQTHIILDQELVHKPCLKIGCIPLLEYLKEHSYTIILATSSYKNRALNILKGQHIDHYFNDFICGDQVKNGKPHPEIFLEACKKIHCEPNQAIVLEDSETGIDAAFQAGCSVICIPDMIEPDFDHKKKCNYILSNLLDVLTIL